MLKLVAEGYVIRAAAVGGNTLKALSALTTSFRQQC